MKCCSRCGLDYPDHLVHPVTTTDFVNNGKNVCGICALEVANQETGQNRKKFDGPKAENLRQEALLWREKNPVANKRPN